MSAHFSVISGRRRYTRHDACTFLNLISAPSVLLARGETFCVKGRERENKINAFRKMVVARRPRSAVISIDKKERSDNHRWKMSLHVRAILFAATVGASTFAHIKCHTAGTLIIRCVRFIRVRPSLLRSALTEDLPGGRIERRASMCTAARVLRAG